MSPSSPQLNAIEWALKKREAFFSLHGLTSFYGAEPHPLLEQFPRSSLFCKQTDYSKAMALQASGFSLASIDLSPYHYDFLIISGTKSRAYNEQLLQEAAIEAKQDATMLFCLESKSGGDALAKRLAAELSSPIEVESKARCKFILFNSEAVGELRKRPYNHSSYVKHDSRTYSTHPALFSWSEPDKGSLFFEKLLLESDECISGKGADIGCGWGMLGFSLLHHVPQIESVTFLDTERYAIHAVERSIEHFGYEQRANALWGDVRQWNTPEFDWIVSNIPYHSGRSTDYVMQIEFVRGLMRGLHRSGVAYVLAHHIPPVHFSEALEGVSVRVLAEAQPYWILRLSYNS